jgi:NADP-dependent 3-hydroxy acid dehydrogenase YdfG
LADELTGKGGKALAVTTDVAERLRKFYAEVAIPAESFAKAVAFAIGQPEEEDVNEILLGPTRQELKEEVRR